MGDSRERVRFFPELARREAGRMGITKKTQGRTRLSTDIWADLGFSPAQAQDLDIRAEMMIALRKFIAGNKLTRARAAKLLGVTQPRVSDLLKGKINSFTIADLIKLLSKAGLKIEVQIRRAA
jgi:predicted XRE-type DNA-binding protein